MASAFAQPKIYGAVWGEGADGKWQPLPSAIVIWQGTSSGVLSDDTGEFELVPPAEGLLPLVVRFAGYQTDTIPVAELSRLPVNIRLQMLSAQVEIRGRLKGTSISNLKAIKTENLSLVELSKAACCNLSESFETNPTVDVSYSDAVTGAKRIQMLGLDGMYTQILSEQYPSIRGLATSFGLGYVPGPWMSSIQISKGPSSVIGGYEGITGQINVEYRKPQDSDQLYFNAYANHMGRQEASLNLTQRFNPKLGTTLMLHGNRFQRPRDHVGAFVQHSNGHDGKGDLFLDLPLQNQWAVSNRWRWKPGKNTEGQTGVSFIDDYKQGGQLDYRPGQDQGSSQIYGFEMRTRRWEGFNKAAVIMNKPATSLGTVVNVVRHEQHAHFGTSHYKGLQEMLHAKAIYATILGNTNHKLLTGISYTRESYRESLNDSAFSRLESVPGAFAEYTYDRLSRLIVVAGLRADWHNMFGFILTPRLHAKFNLSDMKVLRAWIGSGMRVANPVADNLSMLISSRRVLVQGPLNPEKAWNAGISATQHYKLLGKSGTLQLDVYHTQFINQVVVDRETAGKIIFSDLEGQSYATGIQLEASLEPAKGLELRLAGKSNRVRTTYRGELLAVPFVPFYTGFANAGYTTPNERWQFDATFQLIGPARLPNTSDNIRPYQLPENSPIYPQLSAQVTYRMKMLDLYVGGENLTNFVQNNPILAAEQPFGPYFDASLVWGPVMGRLVYAGLRFTHKGKQPQGL